MKAVLRAKAEAQSKACGTGTVRSSDCSKHKNAPIWPSCLSRVRLGSGSIGPGEVEWQQVGCVGMRCALRQFAEDVAQLSLGFDTAGAECQYDAVDDGTGLCSVRSIAEQPGFSSSGENLDIALKEVVIELRQADPIPYHSGMIFWPSALIAACFSVSLPFVRNP